MLNPTTTKERTLTDRMRLAWSQHVYWTRMILLSIAHRLPDLDYVTKRLLRNPYDIERIFADYYSSDSVQLLAPLLTEHLDIGAKIITALRDGKKEEAETLSKEWYINADKMAAAFAGISSYYNEEELRRMLRNHLDLTTKEVTQRLAGNYQADIDAFDEIEKQALMMADYFSSGIIHDSKQMF